MLLKIFLALCFIVYLISAVEIIGSWILTKKKQGIEWHIVLSLIEPLLILPLAPIAASDITSSAGGLYDKYKFNTHHYEESFYQWIKHGFMTIDEWAAYHHSSSFHCKYNKKRSV